MMETRTDYMMDFENILEPGKEPVMTKKYNPQVAYKKDKYLDPTSLKKHVFKSEKIQQLIQFYARKQNCPVKDIEQQVRDILEEIGLDRNLAIIRWCGIAITAIGKRICKGIYVNKASMENVKSGLGNSPVLYLPSHRSYMDFILMSYICFHYDIEIPGIAAGMDFHAMFAMGTMLRKTGAFFVRRSFSNDELYWDIFGEYMHALIEVYHIGVEFFIEGTRSRNFKALVPKIGLLSMALLPFFTGEVSDVTIVPVSVSYEKILEEQLFVYELLGVPKPKESTKGFFKALKIIDENFGKMYLDFGQPISVKEFFGDYGSNRMKRASLGSHVQKLNKNEIELVKKLAAEVIYQQQRRIVVTTFNLICLYYASKYYNDTSVNIDELSRGVLLLKEMFEELGAHVATNANCIKPEIIETVEVHSNVIHFKQARLEFTQVPPFQLVQGIDMKKMKAHALSPRTMAIAVPSMTLQLYTNPCLFWLARPAYLIMASLQLKREQETRTAELPTSYEGVKSSLSQRVEVLDNIFKHEFIIESNRESEEFERNLKFLETYGVLSICLTSGAINFYHNECSRSVLSAFAPFLCIYYQLAATLNKMIAANTQEEFSSKSILKTMQQRIETILLSSSSPLHVHPYCLALDNLNIALHALVQSSYLIRNRETGNLIISPNKSLIQLEQLLLEFCDLMPFKQYCYCGTTSKL